jgi:hypothetical protein
VLLNKSKLRSFSVFPMSLMVTGVCNTWQSLHQRLRLVSMHNSVRMVLSVLLHHPYLLLQAVGTAADKRKSVTYAPSVNLSPDLATGPAANGHSFSRPAGAKSMPASRRTSASSHDEDLAVHIQGLSLAGDRSNRASPAPAPVSASILLRGNGRYGDDEGARYASTYNAGMLLDEQLDQEMHSKSSQN